MYFKLNFVGDVQCSGLGWNDHDVEHHPVDEVRTQKSRPTTRFEIEKTGSIFSQIGDAILPCQCCFFVVIRETVKAKLRTKNSAGVFTPVWIIELRLDD